MRANNSCTDAINRWFSEHEAEMMSDLAELVAVRGVAVPTEGDKPFGEGSYAAIKKAEELVAKYGFDAKLYDNCVLAADLNGGETQLAILAHVDVVEEGDGWDTPPYEMTEKDGFLFGRGVADDKGPAVASLFAMRAAREIAPELTKNCRLILGSAEEIGMGDLPHYTRTESFPEYVFSPDADFPLINIEKGRFLPKFSAVFDAEDVSPRVISIKGGGVSNIVPHRATAVVTGVDAGTAERFCREFSERTSVDITCGPDGGTIVITAVGAASHASAPEKGRNAQTALISMLAAMPFAPCAGFEKLRALSGLVPHGDTCGRALGVEMADDETGALTSNFGVFEYCETGLRGDIDMRTPACGGEENLYGAVKRAFEGRGFDCDVTDRTYCHVTPADSPFVKTLLGIYEDWTGEKGECIAIGGSTYVHEIEGGVAFGSQMPGAVTNIHGANENISKADLILSAKMFTQAILEICE